jgi:hypothetical protein
LRKHLSEGYNPYQIISVLTSHGWSPTVVHEEIQKIYQEGRPHPKLTIYLRKHLSEGYSAVQVKAALMSHGWPAEVVDDEIDFVMRHSIHRI